MAKTGFLDALIDTLQTNCRGVGSESRPTLAPTPAIRSRGKRVRETRSGHRCGSTFPYLHNWWLWWRVGEVVIWPGVFVQVNPLMDEDSDGGGPEPQPEPEPELELEPEPEPEPRSRRKGK